MKPNYGMKVLRLLLIILLVSSIKGWTFDEEQEEEEPVLKVSQSTPDEIDTLRFDLPKRDINPPIIVPISLPSPIPSIDDVQDQNKEQNDEPDVNDSSNQDTNQDNDVHNLPIFDSKEKLEEGRQQYELIKAEAPKYGVCWTNAIQSLHVGCSRLNDEIQARMGLSFANCFLEKVGSKTYPCTIDTNIQSCVQTMDDRSFNTYTHFYTHTQSICFFLANQVWQETTSKVVTTLKDTSIKVSERLIHLQDLQERSINTQIGLNEQMSDSKQTLESFGESLREKQLIETEILKRFLEIKEFILSELSKVYSIGFYVLVIISVYLITTPVRTSSARFWVLLLFAANLAIERYIVSNVLSTNGLFVDGKLVFDNRGIRDVSSEIDECTWIVRKATCLLATIVIFVFWLTYKDYGQMNNYLLSQIREHNLDLKKSTSEIKSLQFLQLQRMGINPSPIVVGHTCNRSDKESDSEPDEVPNYLDIMSDMSDLDSGHEDGVLSYTDSVTRMKALSKKKSTTKTQNREVPTAAMYSPSAPYNLRERKGRSSTPLSTNVSKVTTRIEPIVKLEFSDDNE